MAEGQSIYFDSTYTLRVVEEDKFKDTERLHEECTGFTESELTCSCCALRATGRWGNRQARSCLPPCCLQRLERRAYVIEQRRRGGSVWDWHHVQPNVS
jgi:hypothetical protein